METYTETREERIARSMLDEVERQRLLWKEQNHPIGNGSNKIFGAYGGRAGDMEDILRTRTEYRAKHGGLTYFDILFEEIFEAFAADDKDNLRTELIQSGAVIISMIASLDRNGR